MGFFWFGFGTEALYLVLGFLFIYFFVDKHLSPLCWFVLLLLCRLYRLYWGLVFSAFSARTWTWFWFLILCVGFFFVLRIYGWVCSTGLAVGLALLQFFFFFFKILVQKFFFLKILVQFFLFFFINLRVFLILWLRVFLIQLKYNFFFKFFSGQGVLGNTLTYMWHRHCTHNKSSPLS